MLSKSTENIIKQLKKANLPIEDKIALTNAVLDKLHALPLRKSFVIDGNKIVLNGKILDQQETISFKEGVEVLRDNQAHKLFNEQLRYLAMNHVFSAISPVETLNFSTAALWVLEQEAKLYESLH